MEEGHAEKYVLVLSEEEALQRARQSPDEALDIHIAYADDDPDNPRSWPKWRKWYITIFVSMLNVITYDALPVRLLSSLIFYTPADEQKTEHGAREESHPVQKASKKHLACRQKSRRCVCPCTY